ncbi:protein of unknown function [Candidatus Nitrotoga arctica]|uniref:Transposase n=1 Tax=Candidatus Nitrotoga arctica TaxID=453162 RepID=A0ABN8ATG9_9PROT|nr:protein of unknown function [Candidatus Nitrotoga arctica]
MPLSHQLSVIQAKINLRENSSIRMCIKRFAKEKYRYVKVWTAHRMASMTTSYTRLIS